MFSRGGNELLSLTHSGEVMWSVAGDCSLGAVEHHGELLACLQAPWSVDRRPERPIQLTRIDAMSGRVLGAWQTHFSIANASGEHCVLRSSRRRMGARETSIAAIAIDNPTQTRWRIDRNSEAGEGAFRGDVDLDGRAVYAATASEVFALDLDSGSKLWSADVSGLDGTHALHWQPEVHAATLLLTSGGDHRTVALDAATGRLKWSIEGLFGPRAVSEHTVFVLWYETLVACDLESGTILYRRDLTEGLRKIVRSRFPGFATILTYSAGHLFAGDVHGRLWVMDAENGEIVWSHLPESATGYLGARPTVASDFLYLAGVPWMRPWCRRSIAIGFADCPVRQPTRGFKRVSAPELITSPLSDRDEGRIAASDQPAA